MFKLLVIGSMAGFQPGASLVPVLCQSGASLALTSVQCQSYDGHVPLRLICVPVILRDWPCYDPSPT